jgi:hypothetical protein
MFIRRVLLYDLNKSLSNLAVLHIPTGYTIHNLKLTKYFEDGCLRSARLSAKNPLFFNVSSVRLLAPARTLGFS